MHCHCSNFFTLNNTKTLMWDYKVVKKIAKENKDF